MATSKQISVVDLAVKFIEQFVPVRCEYFSPWGYYYFLDVANSIDEEYQWLDGNWYPCATGVKYNEKQLIDFAKGIGMKG